MARARTLPTHPDGDTGWLRISGETYHREIRAAGLALIAHVSPRPRPHKDWTACVTAIGPGGKHLILDALVKEVPAGEELCEAALATARRELQI